jgi:ornithine carrier protein
MAAATTADFTAETPPALKVKSNQALMDAVEDIVFGSVKHPSSSPTKPY